MGRPRALLLVSLVLALAGAFTAVAVATTGPGYLLNPPKYRIRLGVLRAYTGRYASSSVASGSGIVSSELYIGVAESGYAAGGVSIYSYDSRGMLQAFAGTVYNFRLVGNQVEADIVSTDGTTVLGHVLVRHAGSSRNLVGTLEPPTGGRFAIAYRYAASEGPLPGQAYAPVPLPSGSGVRSGSAKKPAAAPPRPGWGSPGSFLGRYRLTAASPVSQSAPEDGIFSVALGSAEQLLAAARTPTGGELTLFMRTVKKTQPPVPSGILSVVSPTGTSVVYLTHLKSAGPTRTATINGGSFLGPSIGTLKATVSAASVLTASVSAQAIRAVNIRLVRFSRSPEP
jgi:hypothetical protein